MSPSGELLVHFRDRSFRVLFDSDDDSLSRIGDEARRLRTLLDEFNGREQLIEQIDMAYNTMAVVKLLAKEEPVASQKQAAAGARAGARSGSRAVTRHL